MNETKSSKVRSDSATFDIVRQRIETLRNRKKNSRPTITYTSGLIPTFHTELHADIVRICMIPLRVVVLFGKLKLPREEGKIVAIVQIRLTHGPRFDH